MAHPPRKAQPSCLWRIPEWRHSCTAAQTPATESRGSIAEDVSDDLEGYKAITCLACQRTHLVNPTTGKILGEDDE